MPKQARGNQITYANISQDAWDRVFGKKSPEQRKNERAEFMSRQAEQGSEPRTKRAKWPIESAALATNYPEKDAAIAKKHGVNVEFNEDGCPRFNSENHRREYLKAMNKETGLGWFDKSAYY